MAGYRLSGPTTMGVILHFTPMFPCFYNHWPPFSTNIQRAGGVLLCYLTTWGWRAQYPRVYINCLYCRKLALKRSNIMAIEGRTAMWLRAKKWDKRQSNWNNYVSGLNERAGFCDHHDKYEAGSVAVGAKETKMGQIKWLCHISKHCSVCGAPLDIVEAVVVSCNVVWLWYILFYYYSLFHCFILLFWCIVWVWSVDAWKH